MYPNPYGQAPHQPAPPTVRPTSGLAVASLVSGLIGIAGGCCLFGLPCILAVVLGHMATRETRTGERGGHGMAIAGLILGYLLVVPGILFAIQLVAGGFMTLLDQAPTQ